MGIEEKKKTIHGYCCRIGDYTEGIEGELTEVAFFVGVLGGFEE